MAVPQPPPELKARFKQRVQLAKAKAVGHTSREKGLKNWYKALKDYKKASRGLAKKWKRSKALKVLDKPPYMTPTGYGWIRLKGQVKWGLISDAKKLNVWKNLVSTVKSRRKTYRDIAKKRGDKGESAFPIDTSKGFLGIGALAANGRAPYEAWISAEKKLMAGTTLLDLDDVKIIGSAPGPLVRVKGRRGGFASAPFPGYAWQMDGDRLKLVKVGAAQTNPVAAAPARAILNALKV